MSFFEELKRRNVFRVGVAYGIAGWVLLQVADLVLEAIEAPVWVLKALLLVVALGFVAALVISWAYEITADGIKKEADVDRSQSITPDTGRKLDRVIISFLAVAVILLLADRFISSPDQIATEPSVDQLAGEDTTSTIEPAVKTPEKSIAVLPFTNMSDDASNEFFADGISEEILNALAKVKDLKVAGRTSAFAFKGRNEDLRAIGETLGVNHILEGSVRKAGNTVRVTAQLIQVSDGFHLWSETFDRELTDIFAIQDEIANAILVAMKAELIGGQSIASTAVDPVVYEKYLLAKQHLYTRNEASLEAAVELLRETTDFDPDFASAWAQLGIATLLLAEDSYGTIPYEDSQKFSKLYLERALEIEPNNAEALAGMGFYYINEPGTIVPLEKAVDFLERALEISPALIDASNWLTLAYSGLGRGNDALVVLEDMFSRDPLYKPGSGNLMFQYSLRGQFDASMRVLTRIKPFQHDKSFLVRAESQILSLSGEFGKALPLARESLEIDPNNSTSYIGLAMSLYPLGEFEELVEMDAPIGFWRLMSLIKLGRTEEGLNYARDRSERTGNPGRLLNFYHATGRSGELVEYVEQRWPDLQSFHLEFPAFEGFGHGDMFAIAFAYRQTGNAEKYEEALIHCLGGN